MENLKTNLEHDMRRGEQHQRVLTLICRAPNRLDDIMYSPALRFLALMIQRQVADGFDDLATLTDIKQNHAMLIKVKPEYVDDSVFWSSKPKGVGLVEDKPMRSHALTDFLKTRCINAGLIQASIHGIAGQLPRYPESHRAIPCDRSLDMAAITGKLLPNIMRTARSILISLVSCSTSCKRRLATLHTRCYTV